MSEQHPIDRLKASEGWLKGMHPGMSLAAKGMILSVVVFTVYNVEFANGIYTALKDFIITTLNWYYISIVTVVLFFVIWLMFSKFGSLRLGKDDEKPEFSNFAWFSMLFSAGLGLSILYWGVAEPILHIQGNPFLDANGIEPLTAEAAVVAMRITVFHGGIHGWSLYVLVGLTLGYFSYRRGLPLAFRSVLYPMIGDRIYGGYGHAVDLIAVFGTVFGLATSLGLGVASINAGFDTLFGIGFNTTNQLLLIAAISVLGTVSAVSGVGRGVKILSEINIWLSAVFLAVIQFGGATSYILSLWISGIGDYIATVIPMGLWLDSDHERDWQSWWTIFYWGWWIAWWPFVGLFVARISRGRTIREFVTGVLLAPTMLLMFWFCVLGGQAMYAELYGAGGLVEVVNQDYSLGLFKAIESLDWEWAVFPLSF